MHRDKRKRRRDDDDYFGDEFVGDMFEGFEEEFQRMKKHIDRMLKNFIKDGLEPMRSNPFVYGFSMRIGPDGKPQINEFGDKLIKGKDLTEGTEREPLTDVIESDKDISVTVELPGVDKEDINLTATENSLTIDVDTERRKYYKQIPLPCEVIPDTTEATYKNGILDIVIKCKKVKEALRKGKRIQIR